MNNRKTLIGFLIIGLELFVAASAFGAKPSDTDATTTKNKFRSHIVAIPALQPAETGIPCKEVRRWSKVTTFTGCDTSANKTAPPADNAKTFLKTHAQVLKLPPDLNDLKVDEVRSGLIRTVTRFQQTFNNIPVLNAFVSIHQRPSGRVTTVHTSYIKDPLMTGTTRPSITQETAEAIALAGISQLSGVASPALLGKTRSELSWFPADDQSIKLVWAVKTRSQNPQGDFYTLVDASTGDRLLQENQTVFAAGSGMAYAPNPIQTSGILSLSDNNDATSFDLDGQRIAVDLLGLTSGTDLLKGEFVDVVSYNTPTCPRLDGQCPDARNASRTYTYKRNQPEFEQVMVYNAVDSVQRYLSDTLGFQDTLGNATIRNFPTLANAHWYASDNSFYSPFSDNGRGTLQFGDGGVDDAEDADIIVHEFGHAIQHNQNAVCFPGGSYIPQVNEAQAIGEGFSDYLAASFYAERGDPTHQAANAACIAEWDSSAYRSTLPTCLRRVDGVKHYPNDLGGISVHADGEIWSAALWGIRAKLHGPVTDQLILEHHFNLDCSNGLTMPQAALEMIDTDKLLFAGAHENTLRTTFCDRGILTGNACVLSGNLPTVVNAKADSTLAVDAPNRNEGASPELRIRPVNETGTNLIRSITAFDLASINRANVSTARLVMTVQQNLGGWSKYGRNVVAHPLKAASFPEGNGQWLGVAAPLRTTGSGKGVTWNCNTDNDISNALKDCASGAGGDANPWTAAPFVHTNDLLSGDEVMWDVTDDVLNGASGWLINVKKGSLNISGEITYYSKEGNPALAPRLEITFK